MQYDKLIEIVKKIDDIKQYCFVLDEISAALASVSQVDEAIEIASLIDDKERRDGVLERIASILARKGNVDKAMDIASMIDSLHGKFYALCEVVVSLANKNDFDRAFLILKDIKGKKFLYLKEISYRAIGLALIKIEKFEKGIKFIEKIRNGDMRLCAFCDVVKLLVKLDKIEEAMSVFDRIDDLRIYPSDVLLTLVDAGQFKYVLDIIKNSNFGEDVYYYLGYIASKLAEEDNVDEAMNIIAKIQKKSDKLDVLKDIAIESAKVGNIDKAIFFADKIEDRYTKNKVLSNIVLVSIGKEEEREC